METQPLHIAVACIAATALLLGLFTAVIRRHAISQALLATLVGVLIGPAGLDWLSFGTDERGKSHALPILEQVARFTLAITLVSIAIKLPHRYFIRQRRSMLVLLLGGMVLMWAASSLLIGLVLGVGLTTALLLGAIITPTDPVVAEGIVTGTFAREHLPARTRHLLSAESAANDGLAYLFVFLPILLLTDPVEQAWSRWFVETILWDVGAAAVVGGTVGYFAARAQEWSISRGYSERGPLLSVILVLALLVAALVRLMGSDDVMAVFVAGMVLDLRRTQVEEEEQHVQETLKQAFHVPAFVLLGAALPWAKWAEMGWMRAVLLVVAVLLLRRLPAILLLKRFTPQIRHWDEALFVGWFGPVGVAALYYAAVAHKHAHLEQAWVVGSLIIFASILAHGVTSSPLSRWLSRRRQPVLFDAGGHAPGAAGDGA